MALTLWGRRSAFNVQKVLWMLAELGLEAEHRPAGGSHGLLDQPGFLAMNPHGRIPVLVDGDEILWESHTILRYLAAQYGGERFWPASPAARSLADRWMDWSQTALQPDFMRLFWSYYRTPEPERPADRILAARRDCEARFSLLDGELGDRPYLGGSEFGLADVPAGTTLFRYFEMGLDVPHPPAVMAWYERLAARPTFREHVMIPFDDLFGRVEF